MQKHIHYKCISEISGGKKTNVLMTLFKVVEIANPYSNKLIFQSRVPAWWNSHALYYYRIANLPQKSARNRGVPPWSALQSASCVEWLFVHRVWAISDSLLFVCLYGCMICVRPSIRSQLQQLLPPRFPFLLAFIKNGSVNSTVYNKTNAVEDRQDDIRWLFHPAMTQRETVWENQVERSRNKYLFLFCEFGFKFLEMLSSQLLHNAMWCVCLSIEYKRYCTLLAHNTTQ